MGGAILGIVLSVFGAVIKSVAGFLISLGLGGLGIAVFFRHHRRERDSTRDEFRTTLSHALRDTPIDRFNFERLVADCKVPPRYADSVAMDMYADFVNEVVADSVVSGAERDGLDRFARMLCLASQIAQSIELKAKQRKYTDHLADVLS